MKTEQYCWIGVITILFILICIIIAKNRSKYPAPEGFRRPSGGRPGGGRPGRGRPGRGRPSGGYRYGRGYGGYRRYSSGWGAYPYYSSYLSYPYFYSGLYGYPYTIDYSSYNYDPCYTKPSTDSECANGFVQVGPDKCCRY